MQINSPINLSTLYGTNQVGQPQAEKPELNQAPPSGEKADTVSISAEALRKQTETKKHDDATTQDTARATQQQNQTSTTPSRSTKNMAAQRIDLMA